MEAASRPRRKPLSDKQSEQQATAPCRLPNAFARLKEIQMKFNPHPLGLDLPPSGTGQDNTRAIEDRPQLATIPQACKAVNCSRSKLFDMLKAGTLERRKIGRATRVTVASIMRFVGGR